MNKLYHLYIITNKVNNKKYIGVTNNLYLRMHVHFSVARYGKNPYFDNAKLKHGKKNFEMKSIFSSTNRDLIYYLEWDLIKSLNAVKSNKFYNLHRGGRGGNYIDYKNGAISPMLGIKKSKQAIKNHANAIRGKKLGPKSDEVKLKISKALIGRVGYPASDKQKKIVKINSLNMWKKGIFDFHRKPFYDLDGNLWLSIRDCHKGTGMSTGSISRRLSHGKFIYKNIKDKQRG